MLLALSYVYAFRAGLKSALNQSVRLLACDFTVFASSLLALNPTFSSLPSPHFKAVCSGRPHLGGWGSLPVLTDQAADF